MQEKFAKYNGMIEKSMSKFGFALRRKKDVVTKIIPQQKIVVFTIHVLSLNPFVHTHSSSSLSL